MASKMSSFHVAVAAEAFAAGLLAQAGCDVSVQYGANQPEYDLIASKQDQFIKVSVKGSQDGAWGLVQNYKKAGVSYHEAVEIWRQRQSEHIIYCFVQFQGVELGECPRVYLATVSEVADALKAARTGIGDTMLRENYSYVRGVAAGVTDQIPGRWRFTIERLHHLFFSRAA